MRPTSLVLALFLVSLFSSSAVAVELDPSFGLGGITAPIPDRPGGFWRTPVVLQPDGKIVIGADSGVFLGQPGICDTCPMVARFNDDGTLDTSFGTGGMVTTPFDRVAYSESLTVTALGLQSDGSIVAAIGIFNGGGLIARYTPSGVLDSQFGTGGFTQTSLAGCCSPDRTLLRVQQDDRILLARGGHSSLLRLRADGTLDPDFDGDGSVALPPVGVAGLPPDGNVQPYLHGLELEPDGKIVAVYNGAAVRLLADGSLDPTFAMGGILSADPGSFPSLTTWPTSQIPAWSTVRGLSGNVFFFWLLDVHEIEERALYLFSLGADGAPSANFGSAGEVDTGFRQMTSVVTSLLVQRDGRLLLPHLGGLSRYNLDGTLDSAIGQGGVIRIGTACTQYPFWEGVFQPDGRLVVAGTDISTFVVMRYRGFNCGNGIIDADEACDDGNLQNGDGCNSNCQLGTAPTATACGLPGPTPTGPSPTPTPTPVATPFCSNGVLDTGEQCDLGPSSLDSGNCPEDANPPTCSACTRSCSSTCQLIGRCTGSADCCTSAADCPVGEGCCGNGTVESGETCDDGNTLGGDTCTAQCTPDIAYPPIACCPRGSEVAGSTVAANRKLKLTRLDKPAGDQRFNSPGETVLLPGQSIHPCIEDVTYCLESSSGTIYTSHLFGSDFGPKPPCLDADGRLRALFKDKKPYTVSDPDGLKRVQFKNSLSQPNRIKHQVQGQNVDLTPAMGVNQVRQTLVVGDTCMTSVLTCDAGTKNKRCTPVP